MNNNFHHQIFFSSFNQNIFFPKSPLQIRSKVMKIWIRDPERSNINKPTDRLTNRARTDQKPKVKPTVYLQRQIDQRKIGRPKTGGIPALLNVIRSDLRRRGKKYYSVRGKNPTAGFWSVLRSVSLLGNDFDSCDIHSRFARLVTLTLI